VTTALNNHTAIPAPAPAAVDEPTDVDRAPPRFGSILFLEPGDATRAETSTAPELFHDLNLDQIVDTVTAGRVVLFVPHLSGFAGGLWRDRLAGSLFLRVERQDDGQRTFRLLPGEPLETSFGTDLFKEVFNAKEVAS
jgi:hypothetical protein